MRSKIRVVRQNKTAEIRLPNAAAVRTRVLTKRVTARYSPSLTNRAMVNTAVEPKASQFAMLAHSSEYWTRRLCANQKAIKIIKTSWMTKKVFLTLRGRDNRVSKFILVCSE